MKIKEITISLENDEKIIIPINKNLDFILYEYFGINTENDFFLQKVNYNYNQNYILLLSSSFIKDELDKKIQELVNNDKIKY